MELKNFSIWAEKQLVLALRKQFYSRVRKSGVKRSRVTTASTQRVFKDCPYSWFWVLQAGISEITITISPTSTKVLSHTEYTGTSHKNISVTTSTPQVQATEGGTLLIQKQFLDSSNMASTSITRINLWLGTWKNKVELHINWLNPFPTFFDL